MKKIKSELKCECNDEVVNSSGNNLNTTKVLSTVLTLSVLLNIFLVFHSTTLDAQNQALTSVVTSMTNKLSMQSGFNPSATTTTLPKVDTEPVNIAILNDKRCVECDVAGLVARLTSVFPTASIKYLDYGDSAGKVLFQQTGIDLLPAIFFDSSVKDSAGYSEVEPYLVPTGDYFSLKVGAFFDPTAEICDNGIDDTANGMIDCDDPTCVDSILCRDEINNTLDLFVMSQCPYGTQAENALNEVIGAMDNMNYDVHYIASYDQTSGVFSSLHGQGEVDEDIRQLCIKNYNKSMLMPYLMCRNKDLTADWKTCANGLDINAISECASGSEGKTLLIDDIKIGEDLQIGASPTWIANNKYVFSALASNDIKSNYCKYNQDTGCSVVLTATATPVEGSC